MFYIYTTIIVAFFAYLSDLLKPVQTFGKNEEYGSFQRIASKFCYFFALVLLFLISGLRFEVGSDYTTYSTQMVSAVANSSSQTEPLFRMLVKISILLGSSQWVFILSSLIIVVFVSKAVKDQSLSRLQSVILFVLTTFFAFSMNGIRQSIGTAIFLYSIKYIKQSNIIKYAFFIFIAIGFHTSAVIYLIVYLSKFIKSPSRKIVISTLVGTIIAFIFKAQIRSLIYIFVNKFTSYSRYFGSGYDNSLITIDISFLLVNIVVTLVILYTQIINTDNISKLNDLKVYIIIQLVLTVFSGFSFSIPAAFRIFYLFIPIHMILIPNLTSYIKGSGSRFIIRLGIFVMYAALFYEFIINANYNEVLPYQINKDFINLIFWELK